MKPYMVSLTTYGVVMADDEEHALFVAKGIKKEIQEEYWEAVINVCGEIKGEADYAHGWDGECIPYGGDDETRLSQLVGKKGIDRKENARDGADALADEVDYLKRKLGALEQQALIQALEITRLRGNGGRNDK